MELKPIKRYVSPRYPTHDILLEHPELLRFVPKRWRGNKLVLATLGAAVCLIFAAQGRADGISDSTKTMLRVAPLFFHGEGRWVYRGVPLSPIFLTEKEAFDIINHEIAQENVHCIDWHNFSFPEIISKKILLPQIPKAGDESRANLRYYMTPSDSAVLLDGYDPVCKIGYAYLSWRDYEQWGTSYHGPTSGFMDFREAASRMRDAICTYQPEIAVGIFYATEGRTDISGTALNSTDAQASWEQYRTDHLKEYKSKHTVYTEERLRAQWCAEYQLRLQVRDFVEWLKAQGII